MQDRDKTYLENGNMGKRKYVNHGKRKYDKYFQYDKNGERKKDECKIDE